MLYDCETYPANLKEWQRLHRNEKSMIPLMCRVSASDRDCSDLLKDRLNVKSITELIAMPLMVIFVNQNNNTFPNYYRHNPSNLITKHIGSKNFIFIRDIIT